MRRSRLVASAENVFRETAEFVCALVGLKLPCLAADSSDEAL
jgi:hypothetical protein